MEINEEDNYPTPNEGETWEILDKGQFVEDGMIKYSVTVNCTKDDKTVLKKYTRCYRQERISRAVLERRNWTKFGKAANENYGDTSVVMDKPVFFELTNPELIRKNMEYHRQYCNEDDPNPLLSDHQPNKVTDMQNSHITCRYCKGFHFSYKCTNRTESNSSVNRNEEKKEEVNLDIAQIPLVPGKSTYVPSHKRHQNNNRNNNSNYQSKNSYGGRGRGSYSGSDRGRGRGRGGGGRDKPQVKAIKINNISVDTEKEEFEEICQQFGRTYKCNLISNQERGYAYAFVTYTREDNAEMAILELNGYRQDYCIWEAQWAAY